MADRKSRFVAEANEVEPLGNAKRSEDTTAPYDAAVKSYYDAFGETPDLSEVPDDKQALAAELMAHAVEEDRAFASDEEFYAALAYGDDEG